MIVLRRFAGLSPAPTRDQPPESFWIDVHLSENKTAADEGLPLLEFCCLP
jgi:hypothetical protein